MQISDSIRGFGIPDIRDVSSTIVAGPSLEMRPAALSLLKENGVTQVVDFRGGSQPLIERVCKQLGLNYCNFDFNHAIDPKCPVPSDFVNQLKQFLKIMNKGHAYVGCQYGIHRTNAALLYNHILNPENRKFFVPEILHAEGDKHPNTVLNNLLRRVWQTINKMSPEERASFGLKGDLKEIFNNIFAKRAGEIKRNVRLYM